MCIELYEEAVVPPLDVVAQSLTLCVVCPLMWQLPLTLAYIVACSIGCWYLNILL